MTDKANGYGLFCLTTSNLNQLMWCHYGDNEKGLCIEFDGEHPYFKKRTRKVLYSQKRPMVKPLLKNEKLPETEIEEFILKSILVKNRIWIHEDEHRLITSISDLEPKKNENEDVYLGTIPYDSIRSITFGSGTEYSVKQTIWKNKLHLKEWNHLKLFELVKNEKQYGYKVFPLN